MKKLKHTIKTFHCDAVISIKKATHLPELIGAAVAMFVILTVVSFGFNQIYSVYRSAEAVVAGNTTDHGSSVYSNTAATRGTPNVQGIPLFYFRSHSDPQIETHAVFTGSLTGFTSVCDAPTPRTVSNN